MSKDIKTFKVNGLDIISREDYESMPIPMYAYGLDDDKMQSIAQCIYDVLCCQYNIDEVDVIDYFKHNNNNEYIDEAFWREMEEIAISTGMKYYEDMSEEELLNIRMN